MINEWFIGNHRDVKEGMGVLGRLCPPNTPNFSQHSGESQRA